MSDAPLLEVDGLATGYGDVRAVFDVSFTVRPGSIVGLLGRNGAGKTTTLRAIAGVNRIDEGTITYCGASLGTTSADARSRDGIAFVPDGKRVFRRLTIEQNLDLGVYRRRLTRAERAARHERVYELFDVLGARRREVAGRLSGGQQQMLAIGQALMAEPRLLLLDEPSGGLSPALTSIVFEAAAALAGQGIGVVLVDQAVARVLDIADDVVVVDLGRVVARGTPQELGPAERILDLFFDRSSTS